jgi:cytochrome c553
VLHNVGRGSARRAEFVVLAGKMQVPYLVDPNTGHGDVRVGGRSSKYLEQDLRAVKRRGGWSAARRGSKVAAMLSAWSDADARAAVAHYTARYARAATRMSPCACTARG